MMSDSSSSSDDEFASQIAAASVSFQDLTKAWNKNAEKGKQVITRKPAETPKSQSTDANAPKANGAGEDDDDGDDPQPLGIVERRIAAALDARLERILPAVLTASDPPEHKSTPSDTFQDPSQGGQETDLGVGVRLFRRVKQSIPVLLPTRKNPNQDHERPLTENLLDGVAAKRTRIEVDLLQRLLQQKPCIGLGLHQSKAIGVSRPAEEQSQLQPDVHAGMDAGRREADAGVSAVEEFEAAIKRAIQQLSKSLAPKEQVRALKKALKHSAVEGAEILAQADADARVAAVKAAADAAESLAIEGGKKKKKKKKKGKGGVDGEGQTAAAKMEGVVIENKGRFGLKDTSADVRTVKLIGLHPA